MAKTNNFEKTLRSQTAIIESQQNTIKEQKRHIDIKNAYLKSIIAFGFDYDGYNSPEKLKGLIDELVSLAEQGLANDDKSVQYVYEDEHYNILMEPINERD